MPILALVYVTPLIIGTIYSTGKSLIKRKPSFWLIVGNSACDFIAYTLFVGYWCRSMIHAMGVLAPMLFLAALAWRLSMVSLGIYRTSERTWHVVHELGFYRLIIVLAYFFIPLYLFAGMAAFRNYIGN